MGFDSEASGKKQKPLPPAGLNFGVCYSIVDLGTQTEQFPGKPATNAKKMHISWELPQLPLVTFDTEKGPQMMAVFHEYTVSASDRAKLPKVLCSWAQIAPKDLKNITTAFIKQFMGQGCMLNIEHAPSKTQRDTDTGNPIVYANVGQKGLSVMPRMAQIPKPTGTANPQVFFDLDFFSWDAFNSLPKYLQGKIEKSKEWPSILSKYPKPIDATQNQNQHQNVNQTNLNNTMSQVEQPGNVHMGGPGSGNPVF